MCNILRARYLVRITASVEPNIGYVKNRMLLDKYNELHRWCLYFLMVSGFVGAEKIEARM
jgi:hypothetical protein